MMLLDVIVGYFIPDFFGWCFLLFVIVAEFIVLKKLLKDEIVGELYVLFLVIVANLITSIIGFLLSELTDIDYEYHIGHIINYVPIDYYRGNYMFGRGAFVFIASFIITMIFETALFYLGLKKYNYQLKGVIKKSLVINFVTYSLGLILISIYMVQLMNG